MVIVPAAVFHFCGFLDCVVFQLPKELAATIVSLEPVSNKILIVFNHEDLIFPGPVRSGPNTMGANLMFFSTVLFLVRPSSTDRKGYKSFTGRLLLLVTNDSVLWPLSYSLSLDDVSVPILKFLKASILYCWACLSSDSCCFCAINICLTVF